MMTVLCFCCSLLLLGLSFLGYVVIIYLKYLFFFIIFFFSPPLENAFSLYGEIEDKNARSCKLDSIFVSLQIKGNSHVSSDDLCELISKTGKDSFFDLWFFGVEQALLSSPWIATVDSHWRFMPFSSSSLFTLELSVDELTADYVLETAGLENGGESWLISKAGNFISPLREIRDNDMVDVMSNLPRISGICGEKKKDCSLAGDLSNLLSRIENTQACGGIPFEIERFSYLHDGSLLAEPLELFSQPSLVLDSSSYEIACLEISKLHMVTEDLAKRGENAKSVDLRFGDKAVVKNR